MNEYKIILENKDVRMIEHTDYLNKKTYYVDMYFQDDDVWRTVRHGSFYYCHDLYKLLITSW